MGPQGSDASTPIGAGKERNIRLNVLVVGDIEDAFPPSLRLGDPVKDSDIAWGLYYSPKEPVPFIGLGGYAQDLV
jgi:hypothetical protein